MLESLAMLLIFGFIAAKLISLLRLPGLLGMLIVGVVFGPYVFNWINSDMLQISQDLRALALIIILLRAGLGLKRENLAKVGGVALRISSIPCILEGLTVLGISYFLLDLSFAEAGMLGFVLAAVSPAVVVPGMLELKEKGYGDDKQIPTLLLAGTSIDDVFAITLFTFFLGLGVSGDSNVFVELGKIPLSIGAGILGGVLVAVVLLYIFRVKGFTNRNTEQLLLLLALSILYFEFGEWIGIASLLGVMTIGLIILEKRSKTAILFSEKLAKVWVFAQIILFSLVGAEVNIEVAVEAGLLGVVIIAVGLIGRSIGVMIATIGSNLNKKERIFCMIAYSPKATVQAAIGSLPLAAGVAAGNVILAIAVLSILITAPLGAIGIKFFAPRLLQQGSVS
ncbi:NhaP-type Na+/H+ or K+/H+ antiporter [Natronobacillus azotifigens]|uniref:Cation:proton antiporter n=1 Tax=Natronobacillus azotifigens TaxID=472978 RepID=A0A9J6R8S3_9BACI|nr:cation:proton antiporter [Natronobacillus azotifigens]MCZ0701681.1 cation:proton antiporter [Natronobacillus azotifigens]